MAITQTGAIYKSLSFDNTSSRSYGVYITGQAVYNAPQRAVEMITIPGRNGAFALDQGRFENIEVSYPAGIFADNEADFAQAVSDFRNFLCSKKGYCRLTDEYNPNEYRMAVYKSGLDVSPAQLRAGEFDITFECKPQRWLTSGETATAVANNGTITNPTLFESGPLLAIKGYGKIGFNGYEIELENETLGRLALKSGESGINISGSTYTITIDPSLLNAGDEITLSSLEAKWSMYSSGGAIRNATITSNTGITGSSAQYLNRLTTVSLPALAFAKGTSASYSNTTDLSVNRTGGTDFTAQYVITVAYNGSTTITVTYAATYSENDVSTQYKRLTYGEITGESTKSLLGNPTYIDCELGDAYRIEGGEYVSLNGSVDLGSNLPKLASGSNTVTFDNTVTELKITPRWWKV